jgi:hypothetical protein
MERFLKCAFWSTTCTFNVTDTEGMVVKDLSTIKNKSTTSHPDNRKDAFRMSQ